MLINSTVAKILYNRDININSEWAYYEVLQDIHLKDNDCSFVDYKKGDINLTKDWGNTTYWKQINTNNEFYFYFSAPNMFDMILFLIRNNINLCVIHVNDKLIWQVTDMDKNEVYQNTDSTYSRKYNTYNTIEELYDYESELQDGLFKAVEILIEKLSNQE